MPEVLVFLFIVLAIVTCVGHGIWVALAWFFRQMSVQQTKTGESAVERCPWCDHVTQRSRDRCEWCGRVLHGPAARELADLAATKRQVGRFQATGTLKTTAADRLLAMVENRRRTLTAQAQPPATSAAGSPFPTAEPKPEAKKPPSPKTGTGEVVAAESVQKKLSPQPIQPPPRVSPAESIRKPAATSPAKPSTAAPHSPQRGAPATPPKPQSTPAKPSPARPVVPQPPARIKPPRKPWTETLAAFMEERNIHSAELIGVLLGGLLIVGSSAALVRSFWDTLEEIPWIKLAIFVGFSSVVFVVGLYSHHRWKLEYTGRRVLIIATLLVPLNFWATASFSKGQWDPVTMIGELAALGLFACLVGLAFSDRTGRGNCLRISGLFDRLPRLPGQSRLRGRGTL